jgi:hypothetical protein
MRVALLTSFKADRREPLGDAATRVRQAFLDAGLGEPQIGFTFGDHSVSGFVSSVDRVLKRHPELARFVTDAPPMPGIAGARRISNGASSPAAGEAVPWATLQAVAAGVPRSFPFHGVRLHFQDDAFGALGPVGPRMAEGLPGVMLSDSWWVNHRNRALSACTVVDGEPGAKRLPSLPEPVAAIFAACGKVTRTVQAPVPDDAAIAQAVPVRLPVGALMASARPEAARAVQPIVLDYRGRMQQIIADAKVPHDLPDLGTTALGVTAGPMKPAVDGLFKPMGYTVKGGSGTFTIRRRTPSNLTVELSLDVGTWGHAVMAIYKVLGLGFKATLILPPDRRLPVGAQERIGDAARWSMIVDNLAALVLYLDATFVSEIEAAAGPSPEWYVPDR